jgi:hypothetical protein
MKFFEKIKKFLQKTQPQNSNGYFSSPLSGEKKKRNSAYQVYSLSDIVQVLARDKMGLNIPVNIQVNFSQLDPMDCINIYTKCAPIFGIVTSRANKVSATEWHVVPKKKNIDKYIYNLRSFFSLIKEYEDLENSKFFRLKLSEILFKELPDLKPDLSNFENSIYRKSKQLMSAIADKSSEIEEFIANPSEGLQSNDIFKMIVQDLLIHGSVSIYKAFLSKKIYVLPGGSVEPVRDKFVGGTELYLQIIDNQFELFYPNEIAYAQYMPNSSISHGVKPLDSIINLITEYIFFENDSRDKADNFQPPSKLIVFGDRSTGFEDMDVDNINREEQRRIEFKLNRPVHDGAIATLTGYGQPMLVDLSKSDIYASQMARQDQILKFIALVYNASNLEINETGSSGTSGRSTSEAQERSDNSRGVRPLYQTIEGLFNYEIIPDFFGRNYFFEFSESLSVMEQIEVAKLKKESGLMTPNEIRVSDLSLDPIELPEMDMPAGITPEQQSQQIFEQINNSLKNKK